MFVFSLFCEIHGIHGIGAVKKNFVDYFVLRMFDFGGSGL